MKKKNKISIALRVEEEHKKLNEDIGALKIMLLQEVSPKGFADWRMEVMWQLRDFKNQLLKHFDLEEEGGFMTDVLTVAPHAEAKINQLKDEHETILLDLDKILALMKIMHEKSAEQLNEIRIGINDMIATLRQHENEEHRLMQQAYYREYGGPS